MSEDKGDNNVINCFSDNDSSSEEAGDQASIHKQPQSSIASLEFENYQNSNNEPESPTTSKGKVVELRHSDSLTNIQVALSEVKEEIDEEQLINIINNHLKW